MKTEQNKVIDNVANNIDLDELTNLMEKNDKAFFHLVEQNELKEAGKIASLQRELRVKAEKCGLRTKGWELRSKIRGFDIFCTEFLKTYPLEEN